MTISLNAGGIAGEPEPSRREFCAYACQAAALAAAGGLAGCGGSPSSPSGSASRLAVLAGTTVGRVVSVTIDAGSPLAQVGGLATVQASLGTFLVARLTSTSFSALTAVCTHEGCTVNEFAGAQFHCPCHGSEFTASGLVAKGPAARSLPSFPTEFLAGVLSFTA